ncbi:MAG TPA: hypothetical protein VNY27_00860 [Solirubrobacteraceae bacterium]|jgi:hypothetical protein|nr:hypothetical protein [Solirubrobacteraceae bacterium]
MLTGIRRRLTYTNILVTFALVFAMSGGAYAAGKYLITSTKQISPKVLKSLKGANGKAGAAGLAGPAGAQGTQGAPGPQGAAGAKGENGVNGAPGTNGVSVTSKEVAKGATACSKEGGSEFTSASGKSFACNGREGSPWTAGGTLPKGSSEMGVWAEPQGIEHNTGKAQAVYVPISFTIPLAAGLPASNVHFINVKETLPAGCKGSAEKPEAESGNLCIFAAVQEGLTGQPAIVNPENESASNDSGARGTLLTFIIVESAEDEILAVRGTWAVTG